MMTEQLDPNKKETPEIEAKWADKSQKPLDYYGPEMMFGKIWVVLIIFGIAMIAIHCDPVLSRKF